jgi:hypothetical protein
MNETIVILVNREVLAGSYKTAIADQKNSVALLAGQIYLLFSKRHAILA